MNPQSYESTQVKDVLPSKPISSSNTQSERALNHKSGIYWRKNLLSGTDCVPVILSIDNGFVSMKNQTALIFSSPISQVTVRVTAANTLLIKPAGKRFAFVGRSAAYSKGFTEAQQQELIGYSMPADALASTAVGAMAGAQLAGSLNLAVSGLGAASEAGSMIQSAAKIRKSDNLINEWRQAFIANNAKVATAKFRGTVAILVYAFLIIGLFFGAVFILAFMSTK